MSGGGFSFDVFISHSALEIGFARSLTNWLRECGFRVWLAEEQLVPGARFRAGLEQGLRESRHLIAILTDSFASRSWTQRELDLFDLTAELTNRRILAVQIGNLPEGPLDQVFLVHQRIPWTSSAFDPEGLWLLYCGLRDERPGPRANWVERCQQMFSDASARSSREETKIAGGRISEEASTDNDKAAMDLLENINRLVKLCMHIPSPRWADAFATLRVEVAKASDSEIYHLLVRPWAVGQTEHAAIVALALFPKLYNHFSAWPFVDLGLGAISGKFLTLLALKLRLDHEIWFSWVIGEQEWTFLPEAAARVPENSARSHFENLAEVALTPELSFKEAEASYDYGVMITPWNLFHLCWLAVKLGDLAAAEDYALSLCRLGKLPDWRSGRFLARLSYWKCFRKVLGLPGVAEVLEESRLSLGMTSREEALGLKQRMEEIWATIGHHRS